MPNLLRDNEMQVDWHLRDCLRRRTNNIWISSRKKNSWYLLCGVGFHVKRILWLEVFREEPVLSFRYRNGTTWEAAGKWPFERGEQGAIRDPPRAQLHS